MSENKKIGLFSKITDREDAIKLTKDAGTGFVVIGLITALISIALGASALIDALIYIVLGLIMRQFHSRIAAVLLLFFSIISLMVTTANLFGIIELGGTNIILAIILVVAAIRGVEATFKLASVYNSP
ncbi:MAG TPA: hypothetical protein VLL52_00380 [Anaerolineae bacterium]|nr:hypothetical protein [Anaerolineae bacterium]